ncbi:hypothetical protein LTR56_017924 [Elasticomyces elasticus]|nr:hypothetical protein LTR56_017924 [Elasticomyces elasticus]KAK3647225.1 hypothetical protein LTR22_013886 [Elasticomyces elasticus]KAK4913841.1 hypothetical protein LTR49_017877 [Elasticomyces elasticus]KAK5752924.1 hypothetical protein LTS12_016996 [Elasticomyces elasticus]
MGDMSESKSEKQVELIETVGSEQDPVPPPTKLLYKSGYGQPKKKDVSTGPAQTKPAYKVDDKVKMMATSGLAGPDSLAVVERRWSDDKELWEYRVENISGNQRWEEEEALESAGGEVDVAHPAVAA